MAREATPGGLDLLVLHLLSEREMYGYEMVTELEKRSQSVFQLKEGTLYPLLIRLKNQQLLSYRWEESTQGPPRKYYMITDKGRDQLAEMDAAWNELVESVNHLKQ